MVYKNVASVVFILLCFTFAFAIEDYQVTALERHNFFRRKHQATDLRLDSNLNILARQCADYYSNNGRVDHTCPYKKGLGENISWYGSKDVNRGAEAETVIGRWYNEKKYYNFNNPGFNQTSGHFTQLVWKSSTKLGFAILSSAKGTFTVALYSPQGNVNTKQHYSSNVLERITQYSPKQHRNFVSYRIQSRRPKKPVADNSFT